MSKAKEYIKMHIVEKHGGYQRTNMIMISVESLADELDAHHRHRVDEVVKIFEVNQQRQEPPYDEYSKGERDTWLNAVALLRQSTEQSKET